MIQNKNYKRQTRQLSDRQKQLISQKLKGRKKSPQHIEKIRTGMQNYWETVKDGDDII
jgi:mRNA-degrading endonuclease RelE of RelBE toxin-antitoxin system